MEELKENNDLILFENNKIRRQLFNGEWFYSVVDIIDILTESTDANAYWRKLKQRLSEEGNESVTNCHGFKMTAKDGKKRQPDCANRETIFRIIQSVPSPNAEPFKLWFARLAEERIQEIIDPSIAIERARQTYIKKGYDEEWTNTRIKGIGARNDLTNEWKNRGATSSKDYCILTDEISKGTFGITTGQHKALKKIGKQNLRDNMSAMKLALMTLAEVTTTEIHRTNDSQGMKELKEDAKDGGEIASITRKNIERKLGKTVVTSKNAKDFKTDKKALNKQDTKKHKNNPIDK